MSQLPVNNIPCKVLIMAGGTGGHIFPALSIARELMARGAQVEWLGTRQGLEAKLISETDIPLHFISISGMRGKGLKKLMLAPFLIIRALWQSVLMIKKVRPACVLGMGGFVTGPGGLAAKLLGKQLLIHEQNAIAGMSNHLLFPLANIVMEGFAGAFVCKQQRSRLPALGSVSKITVVGNPVREAILQLAIKPAEQNKNQMPLKILVIGGSLGAVAINRVIPDLMGSWQAAERPLLKHQCGAKNLQETQEYYQRAGIPGSDAIQILSFIDNMAEAYAWADLVICRAGASTIAELQVAGVPAILIPYPSAVDDHQTENARAFVAGGGGWLVPQKDLNAAGLQQIIETLSDDRGQLAIHASAARQHAIRDAAARAAELCLEACHAG